MTTGTTLTGGEATCERLAGQLTEVLDLALEAGRAGGFRVLPQERRAEIATVFGRLIAGIALLAGENEVLRDALESFAVDEDGPYTYRAQQALKAAVTTDRERRAYEAASTMIFAEAVGMEGTG